MTDEGKLRFSPTTHRTLGDNDADLLDAFRLLVTGEKPWPLFVTGKPGRGKTCGALSLLDHATSGIYLTTNDLVGRRMASFKLSEPDTVWDTLFNVEKRALVVVDELGTRTTISDTHYECIQQACDYRQGYPLILISNLSLSEIEQRYDDRIASRCAAGTVVELKGIDRRAD